MALKGDHTFEINKYSLVHINLAQSQSVHTNTGVDTWLVEVTKQLQTET